MTKPRLTTAMLEDIIDLYREWEDLSHQHSSDEEGHWDQVNWRRSIEEWAKAELERRKLRKESKSYPKERVLTPESDEEADRNARAMAASIIRIRRERQENNND